MIITGQRVVEWVARLTNEYGNYGAAVGIGQTRNGELNAGVVFNEWNGVNICAHISSVKGAYVGRELLWYGFYYAFEEIKVKRITGLVGEGNITARRFNEHLGFKIETRLKDAHPTGDMLVYRMYKHECRWLNTRRPKVELSKAA